MPLVRHQTIAMTKELEAAWLLEKPITLRMQGYGARILVAGPGDYPLKAYHHTFEPISMQLRQSLI
jgi:hypothetical protein